MQTSPLVLATLLALSGSAWGAECQARSGPERATLIELFTSEGCDSCPPADRWLSGLLRGPAAAGVVALAFHVDYWNRLGWRDPYSSADFTARQEARQKAGRSAFLYTPQVTLDGGDFRDWRSLALPRRGTGTPPAARADITLQAASGPGGILAARVEASAPGFGAGTAEEAGLYLALVENRLSTDVLHGENAGRRLEHDAVVREWIGPQALDRQGRVSVKHQFRRNDVDLRHAALVAVVETTRRLEPLQALRLDACP